ncbi:MAG TPA: hypothetical protein VIN75_08785, partial [Burkholderiaceae bacterium]
MDCKSCEFRGAGRYGERPPWAAGDIVRQLADQVGIGMYAPVLNRSNPPVRLAWKQHGRRENRG